ncbi:FUSC family protein [Scopulibacillus cellulosilyticus]|uniref:FUSC family protein n=1 Tax=Scopulibacillus cellulosilyticus TaxID=2665665 RepID=A0ABW2Q1U4_9BACL
MKKQKKLAYADPSKSLRGGIFEESKKNEVFTPPPPKPLGFRAAFKHRQIPFPWLRAMGAGLSIGLPLLIGIAFNHFVWGLLANMGGFTFLYAKSNETYAKRAVKLLFVACGLAISFGLGTFCAPSLWMTAIAIGIVSAGATFLCGAFNVTRPAGFFFVMAFGIGTGLPINPSQAPLNAILAFAGGMLSWLIAMAGWLVKPHGPETNAVTNAFREVSAFIEAIGTPKVHEAEHRAAVALRNAEDAVTSSIWRRQNKYSDRLLLLKRKANALFLAGIELAGEKSGAILPECPAAIRAIADTVADPLRAASLKIPEPEKSTKARKQIYAELLSAAAIAEGKYSEDKLGIQFYRRRSLRSVFQSAFDMSSLVLPSAFRNAIVVVIATLIAHVIGSERPYWVPISCAAVLEGMTFIGIFHRTLQRSIGTMVGIIIGALILTLEPQDFTVALLVMLLQFGVELYIPRNYGAAVTMITPLALLIAEAGQSSLTTQSLIADRLFDILLGSVIGFIGGILLWRRAASLRLPAVIGHTIRYEGKILSSLFDKQENVNQTKLLKDQQTLESNLVHLRTVYDNAINESTRPRPELESLWPAVIAAQKLGQLLIAIYKHHTAITPVPVRTIEQINEAFHELETAVIERRRPKQLNLPVIPEYPRINMELQLLHQCLEGIHTEK